MLKRRLLLLAVLGLLVGSGIATIFPAGASTLPTRDRSVSAEKAEMAPMATLPDPLWHVWLDNPHYLEVPNAMWVDLIIENQGEVGGYVNWTLWVNTTQRANDTLWVDAWSEGFDTYELTANGTFAWDKGPGYYELLLEVEYYGKFFEAWSWFVVREVDLEVWLIQDYSIYEDETMPVEVHIANNGGMAKDVNWSLWVNNSKRIEHTDFHVAAISENTTFVYLTANLIYPWYRGPGYYDVYLNVSYYGKLYEAWCWFVVKEKGPFEVWIEQDYYFYSSDWLALDLHINNVGPFYRVVNASLGIDNGSGMEIVWTDMNCPILAWTDNVTYWSTLSSISSQTAWYGGSGWYEVELNVTSYGKLYQAWCWFYVDYTDPYYVSIIQDYYAEAGNQINFRMNITDAVGAPGSLNATLEAYNAQTGLFTIYTNTSFSVASFQEVILDAWWAFDQPGYYEIYLRAYSSFYAEWYYADCWIIIRDFRHDIWIDQPYYAELHEAAYFELWFNYSSIPSTMDMDQLNVTLWANDTMIYDDPSVDLTGTAYWSIPVEYSFAEPGYYDIWLRVYNTSGALWYEAWCYIWIAELEVDLWIEQEYYFDLSDPAWFDLYVVMPYNDFFYDKLNVTLLVDDSNVFNGSYLFKGEWDQFEIGAIWESFIHVDRIFLAPGYYDIELLVEYQGQVWSAWCYIWIEGEGKEGFELWIDQDTWAKVGEEVWMTFHIQSHFSHDMPAVEVKIKMEGPSTSASEILYHRTDIAMPAGFYWNYTLSYTFPASGICYVKLILWDDIRTEWSADCQWEVSDGGADDAFLDINAPEKVQVDEPFEVDAKIWAGIQGDLLVYSVALWNDNDGTLIANESASDVIPAETSRQYSFTVTLEDIGWYTVRVTADTNKGMLENKVSIQVVEELDESDFADSKSSEPSAISPGFELLALALAGAVLLGLRRRR